MLHRVPHGPRRLTYFDLSECRRESVFVVERPDIILYKLMVRHNFLAGDDDTDDADEEREEAEWLATCAKASGCSLWVRAPTPRRKVSTHFVHTC